MRIFIEAFGIMSAIGIISFTALGNTSSAQSNTNTGQMREDAKSQSYQISEKDITTITFSPASAEVSEEAKSTLTALGQKIKNDNTIDNIVVAAWSDQDFPMSKNAKLPEKDQNLAKDRAKNLKEVLNEIGLKKEIETYSMAENPGWIARVFQTDEAQLKRSMTENVKSKDASIEEIAQTLKNNGGPSKAVVIIKYQNNKNVSH